MTSTDTDWCGYAARLVATLIDSGDLHDPAWVAAVAATPRHLLVPTAFQQQSDGSWDEMDTNGPGLALTYSTATLVTEVDDGGKAISSSTKPDLMVRMLETLDVHDGNRVLEIGTGTGYNAALLSHRLGARHVFSIDVDLVAAVHAWQALGAIPSSPPAMASTAGPSTRPTIGLSPPALYPASPGPGQHNSLSAASFLPMSRSAPAPGTSPSCTATTIGWKAGSPVGGRRSWACDMRATPSRVELQRPRPATSASPQHPPNPGTPTARCGCWPA